MATSQSSNPNEWSEQADNTAVVVRPSRPIPSADDSIEFHAARLLLLLFYAGGRKKRIEGRTKIAKLDFLVRYPTYLREAARIKNVATDLSREARPESRMIRYKYGPGDAKYYDVFALLVAKELIDVNVTAKGDVFVLTEKGEMASQELDGAEFAEIVERCKLVYKLFGQTSGSAIKNFVYHYFTDVVDRPLGAEIDVQ